MSLPGTLSALTTAVIQKLRLSFDFIVSQICNHKCKLETSETQIAGSLSGRKWERSAHAKEFRGCDATDPPRIPPENSSVVLVSIFHRLPRSALVHLVTAPAPQGESQRGLRWWRGGGVPQSGWGWYPRSRIEF